MTLSLQLAPAQQTPVTNASMSRGPLSAAASLHHAVASIHPPSAHALGIATRSGRGGVALTFDDGPHPDGTPAILEILAEHGATATFFVVGEQVQQRPALVRRIVDAGHAVALHGQRHLWQTRRSAAQLSDDYVRGIAAIQDATGAGPKLHRPPFGIYSPAGLRLAWENDLMPLLWSAWGRDWRRFTSPERIARSALHRTGAQARQPVGAGDVILLHDADFYSAGGSHIRTAGALAIMLDKLRVNGLTTDLPF